MQLVALLLAIVAALRSQQPGQAQLSYIPADEPVFDALMEV